MEGAAGPAPRLTYALAPVPPWAGAQALQASAAYALLDVQEQHSCGQLLQHGGAKGAKGAKMARAAAFVTSRAVRRLLVAHRLQLPATGLRFAASPTGQPRLQQPGPTLHLALSHTARTVACAVCSTAPCGIDLEESDRFANAPLQAEALAARFFAAEEVTALRTLPVPARAQAFLRLWTLKEALLKAHGTGLRLPLRLVRTQLGPEGGCDQQNGSLQWAQTTFDADAGLGAATAANLVVARAGWPQATKPPIAALAMLGARRFFAEDAAGDPAFAAAIADLL